MKYKPRILTILFIVLTLFFFYQVYSWYILKLEKWDNCEEISDEEPNASLYSMGTESYNNENMYILIRYTSCLGDYSDIFMMYRLMQYLSIISIGLVIISWRFDYMKKKKD